MKKYYDLQIRWKFEISPKKKKTIIIGELCYEHNT